MKYPFDDEKYNLLFKEFYTPLCRYSCKLVNNPEIAEDVVQEVFIDLWLHKERIQNICSLPAYMYKAVKNRSLNYIKKQYVTTRFVKIEECIETDKLVDRFTAAELLENLELEILLEKAISSLPEKCRNIFSLKRFAEMTNVEIALHLNISVKTVEAQMTIALKKLIDFISRHSQHSSFILYYLFIKD